MARDVKEKYLQAFNRLYRDILKQSPLDGEWELMRGPYSWGKTGRPTWNDFDAAGGSVMAVRQVAINGRLYWAVATTTSGNSDETAAAMAMTGRLGIAAGIHLLKKMKVIDRTHVRFTIWEMDPHLPYRAGDPEVMARQHTVRSHAELKALDL